jgi:hypothetical protein
MLIAGYDRRLVDCGRGVCSQLRFGLRHGLGLPYRTGLELRERLRHERRIRLGFGLVFRFWFGFVHVELRLVGFEVRWLRLELG